MIFYVYYLKSTDGSHFYIGQTNDLDKRLKSHNNGSVPPTKRYLPWCLIGSEKYSGRSAALKREKYLKSHAGREFLKEKFKTT